MDGLPGDRFTAASQELAELLARVLVLDGGVGTPTRSVTATTPAGWPARSPIATAGGWWLLAERERIDLAASYAYSDSSPTCRCCVRWGTRWR